MTWYTPILLVIYILFYFNHFSINNMVLFIQKWVSPSYMPRSIDLGYKVLFLYTYHLIVPKLDLTSRWLCIDVSIGLQHWVWWLIQEIKCTKIYNSVWYTSFFCVYQAYILWISYYPNTYLYSWTYAISKGVVLIHNF